jgi:hypothetical protein
VRLAVDLEHEVVDPLSRVEAMAGDEETVPGADRELRGQLAIEFDSQLLVR